MQTWGSFPFALCPKGKERQAGGVHAIGSAGRARRPQTSLPPLASSPVEVCRLRSVHERRSSVHGTAQCTLMAGRLQHAQMAHDNKLDPGGRKII